MKHRIASIGEIPPGQGKAFTIGGKSIAVFHVGGRFHALLNVCSHKGFPIDEGPLDGCIVTCPYLGAQFVVTTGKNGGPPAPSPIPAYPFIVEGNELFIEM
ncbi:MAG: Rieske 2Fe-2S domain-containing protein, partial [archaeon]